MKSNVITIEEAAQRLGVTKSTVRRGAHVGLLRAEWCGLLGDRIKGIYADSVQELIASRPKNGGGDGYETREIHPKAKGGAR